MATETKRVVPQEIIMVVRDLSTQAPRPYVAPMGITIVTNNCSTGDLAYLIPNEVDLTEEMFIKLKSHPDNTPDDPVDEDENL